MTDKKTSWNIASQKANKKEAIKQDKKEENDEKETKRKMIRIGEEYHEKAKFNNRRMQLQKYIEALIDLDESGKVDWS